MDLEKDKLNKTNDFDVRDSAEDGTEPRVFSAEYSVGNSVGDRAESELKPDDDDIVGNIAASGTDLKSESAESTAEPEKKKKLSPKQKKILTYALFIVINALVVGGMLLLEDHSGDVLSGKEAFLKLGENWVFTLIAFLMYPAIVLFDVIVFKTLIGKSGRKKNTLLSLEVTILGRYYDKITPWSIGGEPFQMAYLVHGGMKVSESCAITMSRHIIRFFTNAVIVIAILVASRITTNVWVMVVAILSIFGGLVIPIFMLVCAFKPQVGQAIGRWVIGVGHKLKIIKNYDKQLKKMQKNVDNFLQGIKYLSANKGIIAIIAVAAVVELFATNSAPYFVIRAMGVNDIQYWNTLVLCLFVSYCSSFAPTPGGAGIAELSFYAIFAAYIGDGVLFWAVLFWRIAIFYVPVFIGFVLQTADSVASIVRAGKSKPQ